MNAAYLTRLKLTDFRNYRQLALDLDNRHVVLTGENGAGKTNLMEAVSLLSPGRGLRRAAYADISRKGSETGFAVFAALEGMQGPVEIGTSAGGDAEAAGGSGRRLRINATNARSNDELLEHLRIVWLTPAMDGLFTGSASDRRRFLDRQVLAIDPGHGRRVLDYERAMRSRNRLLSEGRLDPAWLEGIETQMAELGVAIALARRELIAMLTKLIDERQDEGPFPQAVLLLEDFLSGIAGGNAAELEEDFASATWRFPRPRCRRRPDPDRAAPLGSESASSAARTWMRPAAPPVSRRRCWWVWCSPMPGLTGEICGCAPLLLLDEIAAHLDAGRRQALFDLVDALGGQALMTGTDAGMFSALGERARYLTVSSGTVADAGAD